MEVVVGTGESLSFHIENRDYVFGTGIRTSIRTNYTMDRSVVTEISSDNRRIKLDKIGTKVGKNKDKMHGQA